MAVGHKKGGERMEQPLMGWEKQYRSTVNRIAVALLVFYGLFNVYSLVMSYLVPLAAAWLSYPFYTVFYEGISGLLYAAVFLVPVLVFVLISKHSPRMPLDLRLSLPRETPLYIFAVVALVSAAGYVNSWILEPLDYRAFTDEMLFDVGAKTNVELLLTFFTLCIVPAFVEELLFRGVILKNLLPFGRTTAVLASALLFGVMHQNAGQLLYATVAGLALGYVFLRTGSFWCCVLIHFCNNFLSLFTSTLWERLPQKSATSLLFAVECAVFIFGIVAAVLLALSVKSDQAHRSDEEMIPLACRVRLFFAPPMVVYFALCLAQIASLVLLALWF